MRTLKARCPSKVILTGEHSVVYQQPAIALAVDCYSTATFQTNFEQDNLNRSTANDESSDSGRSLLVELPDLDLTETFGQLDSIRAQLKDKHNQFLAGKANLPLCSPTELVAYTTGAHGQIKVLSDVPLGSGMGSSASVIGAVATAAHSELTDEQRLALAIEAEQLQHGRSSGLDVLTCMKGGIQGMNLANKPDINHIPPMTILFTGTPQASTGEVVQHVNSLKFDRWQDFAEVSMEMLTALSGQNHKTFFDSVKANHRLLCEIGVVPKPIQTLIHDIETQGGCAKISGAGSHIGDPGGIVLVWGVQQFNSHHANIHAQVDWQGAQLI